MLGAQKKPAKAMPRRLFKEQDIQAPMIRNLEPTLYLSHLKMSSLGRGWQDV